MYASFVNGGRENEERERYVQFVRLRTFELWLSNKCQKNHLATHFLKLKLLSACDGSLAGRIGNVTKSIRTPGIQDLSLHFNLMNAKHGNAFAQMHTKHIMNCTVISRWTACQIVIIRLQNNTSIISKIN